MDVLLRAVDFLAGALFAAVFLAGAFFAALFLVEDPLEPDRWPDEVRAAVFFAGRLAVFLAVDPLPELFDELLLDDELLDEPPFELVDEPRFEPVELLLRLRPDELLPVRLRALLRLRGEPREPRDLLSSRWSSSSPGSSSPSSSSAPWMAAVTDSILDAAVASASSLAASVRPPVS